MDDTVRSIAMLSEYKLMKVKSSGDIVRVQIWPSRELPVWLDNNWYPLKAFEEANPEDSSARRSRA